MAEFRAPPLVGDEAVMSTNDEATCSKKYAVSLGYWRDPYINLICRQSVRKTPEISRGYFARVFAVRSLVEQFIKTNSSECQVISLGAGFDTMFWNLKASNLAPARYVELDFNKITRQKTLGITARKNALLDALGDDYEVLSNKLGITSPSYSLLPADLRNTKSLDDIFNSNQIDFSRPTLFLTECVLMYIPQESTDNLLSYLSQKFTNSHFITYDVVNMSDKFAEVMLSNLGSRQCEIHIKDAQSKQTQTDRFMRCNWRSCHVHDMNEVYKSIPQSDRSRIERIEMLDEVHLLAELLHHYCICVASNTDNLIINCDNLTTSISATPTS